MDNSEARGIFRVTKGHFRRTLVLFASMCVLCAIGEASSALSIILVYWHKSGLTLEPEQILELVLFSSVGLVGFVILQKYLAAKAIAQHVCQYMSPSFFGRDPFKDGHEQADMDAEELVERAEARRQAIVDLVWKERLMAYTGVAGYICWWLLCPHLRDEVATFIIVLVVGIVVNGLYFIRLQEFNPIPLLCHNTVQSRRLITMLEEEEGLRRNLELARPLPLVRRIGMSFDLLMSTLWFSLATDDTADRRGENADRKPHRPRLGKAFNHGVTSYHIYSTGQFLFMMFVVMITMANLSNVEGLTRTTLVIMVALQMTTLFVVQLYRFFMRTMPRGPDDHESRAVAEAFGIISTSVAYQERMARIARYDQDLGIPRRWVFDQVFADGVRAFMRGKRGRRTDVTKFSIVFLDVDYFGQVNKRFGHQAGDIVLAQVADVIAQVMENAGRRGTDAFARFGGEEFVIFFANAGVEHAYEAAEEIRRRVFDVPRLSGMKVMANEVYYGWDPRRVSISSGVLGSDQWGFDEAVLLDDGRTRDEPDVVSRCIEIVNQRLFFAKNSNRMVTEKLGMKVRNRVVAKGWTKAEFEEMTRAEAAGTGGTARDGDYGEPLEEDIPIGSTCADDTVDD